MIFARSAAMAFNRLVDHSFDAKNPRTAIREIPAGQISVTAAIVFVILNAAGFMIVSFFINKLCFYLAPVALLVILGYSYTKRFTPLCHLVLGLGLALAPIGAYLAITEEFALTPVLIGIVVLFWVSGFDIIYSLQDEEFDKENKLLSIPVLLGKKNALLLSRLLHVISAIFIILIFFIGPFSWLYITGAGIFIFLLIYQHTIISHNNLSKINLAFFTTNGFGSILFSLFACCDLLF